LSSPPVVVAGIDPGSRKTGYAFLEVSERKIIVKKYGVIKTEKFPDIADKILCIHQNLSNILKEFVYVEAALEDIFFQRNIHSAFILGTIRGAIILTLKLHGARVFSYPPAVVKKTVCAYGNAGKEQVLKNIKMLLGLENSTIPIDASDALAVALTHSRTLCFNR